MTTCWALAVVSLKLTARYPYTSGALLMLLEHIVVLGYAPHSERFGSIPFSRWYLHKWPGPPAQYGRKTTPCGDCEQCSTPLLGVYIEFKGLSIPCGVCYDIRIAQCPHKDVFYVHIVQEGGPGHLCHLHLPLHMRMHVTKVRWTRGAPIKSDTVPHEQHHGL